MGASSSSRQQNNQPKGLPEGERLETVASPRLYDAFISHRGPDVKETLASELFNSLQDSGYRAFLDSEEIQGGDSIPTTLHNAICSSLVQIAIFSPGYAHSKWCLDELVLMLQQSEALFIPVFYGVPPWHLRHIEKGSYAAAFSEYETKGRYLDKLGAWKKALNSASDVAGYELSKHKQNLCKKIVSAVVKEIEKRKPLYVAKHPVGLTELIEDFEFQCLKFEKEKVKIVGIFGLGGSGKTTLAKELFNRKRSAYDRSCFLYDVRESYVKDELQCLQSKLLKDLFGENRKFEKVDEGIAWFKHRATGSRLRFLIFVDDVDHQDQLDALLFDDMLSSGSLVIVTTRDERVLTRARIVVRYKMEGMDRHHASQLFCWHAFLQSHPATGYEDLVDGFLNFCGGLPLSLKVLGAHVSGSSDRSYWQFELDKVKRMLPEDIKQRLKISFDALDSEQKQIFMDIACFFIGKERYMATKIWKASGWNVEHALQILRDKSLVELVKNRHTNWQRDEYVFRMHDHLRDLGRDMADELGPPRLWRSHHLKSLESKGFAKILTETKSRCFHSMRDSSISSQIVYFLGNLNDCGVSSIALLWLELELDQPWSKLKSIPSWIPLQNLQGLRVNGSLQNLWAPERIQQVDQQVDQLIERKGPVQLKDLELNYRSPFPPKLAESLGMLEQLESLMLTDMNGYCNPLLLGQLFSESLTKLGNLKILHLGSDSLGGEMILSNSRKRCCMNSLETIVISHAGLSKLSISGETCPILESLTIQDMKNLTELDLKLVGTLSRLHVQLCSKLRRLPGLSDLTDLVTLKICKCEQLEELPSVAGLSCLESIHIYGCKKLERISGFEELQGLKYLTLSAATASEGTYKVLFFIFQKLPSEVTTVIGRTVDGARSVVRADLFSHLINAEAVTEIPYIPNKYGDTEIPVNMIPSLSAIVICASLHCSSNNEDVIIPTVGQSYIPDGDCIAIIVISRHMEISHDRDDSVDSIVKLSSGVEINRGFRLSVGLGEEWRTLPIFTTLVQRLLVPVTIFDRREELVGKEFDESDQESDESNQEELYIPEFEGSKEELNRQWADNNKALQMIRGILMYMDGTYVTNFNKTLVNELGMKLWRENIVKISIICDRLRDTLLDLVHRERMSEIINRGLMRNIIKMLMEASVYQDDFERPFLNITFDFYRIESQQFIECCDCGEYMKKAERRLNKEIERVSHYLDPWSEVKITNVVDKEMIANHMLVVVRQGLSWDIEMASGAKISVESLVKECVVDLGPFTTISDLHILPLGLYKVILGMDWVSTHRAKMDYYHKTITCADDLGVESVISRAKRPVSIRTISDMQLKSGPFLDDHPILREFTDVFLGELPGLPPPREIDFHIDLVPRAEPISRAPYQMTTPELYELKLQLEGLLEKGLICPTVSPWGALGLEVLLMQEGRVVAFESRKLKDYEINYLSHDLELTALYGRECMTPLSWERLEDIVYFGPALLHDMEQQVVLIRQRLQKAHDRQKKYANQHRTNRSFDVGMKVFLRVRPHKSPIHYGKGSKLAPRFVGTFEILERIGPLAYHLALLPILSHIHDVFHV
ncbi:hypothetical protein KI387_032870 [Taxus chinensis]|uniref:TIR domain-containing protein n=1 Tax=Taxus chinensis TaxID=29808 RepID=A0AA38C343_TAXCH|nr:hypothetical protein KI387_032870 [Taxus chinensis]